MADKRIKDLTNTAAESDIASGNYFALDGSAGTKKLNSTTLLTKTAQNALAGNVAPAFDPTRDEDHKYLAGESVAYDGKTYTFKVDHYGAWAAADVQQVQSVDTKLSKADALSETTTTIMDKHIGGIATNGTWFSSGQHTAVSIRPGDVFLITPKSTSATAGLYAFVTSDYVPGDHTSGAVPLCSGTSRQQIDINTQKMAIAPADAAYLLLCTVDGAANKTFFDVLKKTERNKFAELFAGKAITKDYFIKNVDYLEYESYTGIVGTSTAWLNAGKHIAVPVNPGDTISVKPSRAANLTVVTPSYVPGNHTSGNVEFAIQNIGRQVVDPDAFTTIIAGVDAGYLILHIVDGGGNKVSWEIKKSIDVKLAESLVGMLSDGYKTLVSIDSLTTYKGALSGSGEWFSGTNVSHKALPVIPGDKYTISIPTNYSGNFAVVTSDYVPGDHTSGAVPFAGVSTNRTVVSGNTSIDITIPGNGAYLILTVHDGANMGVVYDVKKFTRTQKPLGTFQKLRYAHWNIGHFAMGKDDSPTITPEEKSEKQSAFREFINSIHPDVLGVCEDDPYFATDETESSEAVYSCFEQQHPGLKASYSMNSFYSNGLKILQFSWQSFPADTAGGRLFSEMLVDLDGDLVIMCETHLSWEDYEKRTNQIQYLVERYASAKYVIIAADWNIGEINGGPSEEEEMAPLVSAGYRMSMMDYMPKESTYAGNNVTPPSDSALDIICAKGFGLINAHVSQESAELSDHRLVYCDLIKNP